MPASTHSDRPYAGRAQIHPDRWRDRLRIAMTSAVLIFATLGAPYDASGGAPGPEEESPIESSSVDPSVAEAPSRPLPTIPIDHDDRSPRADAPSPWQPLDPSARLLEGSDASEYWTLYIELESGHRVTQRFLLSNAGPGDHNAVAIGHFIEPGRAPYRYENGRRRARWTLSDDRLFFDIAASHLDLHRPTGELRITKDDIELRLFFDFAESGLSGPVPRDLLPQNYHVDVLAVAAKTHGTIQAPWMSEPIETRGRTWLVHTWMKKDEAELLDRRIEIYGYENGMSFYGMQMRRGSRTEGAWILARMPLPGMVESVINIPASWLETPSPDASERKRSYPVPGRFDFSGGSHTGRITLGQEWLRFDPFDVIPQPFRWFLRRRSKPQEVWAQARIGVTLLPAPESPSLPDAGERESDSNSNRETETETAERSVTGVASITFLNPSERR